MYRKCSVKSLETKHPRNIWCLLENACRRKDRLMLQLEVRKDGEKQQMNIRTDSEYIHEKLVLFHVCSIVINILVFTSFSLLPFYSSYSFFFFIHHDLLSVKSHCPLKQTGQMPKFWCVTVTRTQTAPFFFFSELMSDQQQMIVLAIFHSQFQRCLPDLSTCVMSKCARLSHGGQ